VKLFTLNIRPFVAFLLVLSMMAMHGSVWGGTTYWQAGTGNWSTAANWDNGEPGLNDTAYISNGGTALITSAESCVQLILADQPGSSGSVEMNPGVLFSKTTELVGLAGTGVFVQAGGTNTTYQLICGFYANSSGSYDLSGGTLAVSDKFYIGHNGKGTFTVTGNSAVITAGQYKQNSQSVLNSVFDSGGISLIDVSGSAVLNGTWNITDPSGNAPAGLFNVLTAAGGITGAFGNVILPNTTDWSWGIDGGTTLWVQHVPEPTTLLLFGLGGLMFRKK